MEISAKTVRFLQKASSQKSGRVPNIYILENRSYKMPYIYKLKQEKAKKVKLNNARLLESRKHIPTHSPREDKVSRTTQASFLAKFKTTHHKLGQKGHRHSVYMIYIYILYIMNIYMHILYIL